MTHHYPSQGLKQTFELTVHLNAIDPDDSLSALGKRLQCFLPEEEEDETRASLNHRDNLKPNNPPSTKGQA